MTPRPGPGGFVHFTTADGRSFETACGQAFETTAGRLSPLPIVSHDLSDRGEQTVFTDGSREWFTWAWASGDVEASERIGGRHSGGPWVPVDVDCGMGAGRVAS